MGGVGTSSHRHFSAVVIEGFPGLESIEGEGLIDLGDSSVNERVQGDVRGMVVGLVVLVVLVFLVVLVVLVGLEDSKLLS